MARKKTAVLPEENNNIKGAEIIVLNEGHSIDVEELREAEKEQLGGEEEMVEIENVTPVEEGEEEEEDLHILGENDEVPEIVIDTTHLDEELNISDVFKESGVSVMPIGGKDKEEKKEKKKHKHDKEEKAEEPKELSKEVLAAFTMVLKNKDYEPIPYPFGDNDMAYNLAFEQCVEMVDHMAVAKFTRNNPTRSLKDAFKNVFTVAEENTEDNNKGEQEVSKRKSEELIKPEVVKPLTDVEDKEESCEVESTTDSNIDRRMQEICEAFDKEIEGVLMKVLDKGSEDPEDVLKALLDNSKELEESSMGKLIKKVTGTGISDIIRAEINGDTTNEEDFKNKFEAAMEKLVSNADKLDEAIDSDMDLEKFIDIILQVLTPDVKDMSLLQIMRARKDLVPHMTDAEFAKWLAEIRKERSSESTTETVKGKESESDKIVDKNNEEIEKHKSQLERDMSKVEGTSTKFYTAMSFSRNLLKNMGVKTAQ